MDLFDLTEQTALVTGAASGIGRAIAVGLAEAGAKVLCFDVSEPAGTVAGITGAGGSALPFRGSVCSEADLAEGIATAERELGALSIAVNCAGIANATPAQDMPQAQWEHMLNVNLTGVFLSCKREFQAMAARKRGAIVNIGSMSGVIANRGLSQCHYNTAKAGVIHLTKSLATEWSTTGIRVNCISPGYTATPMNTRAEVAERVKVFEQETPMHRMASPQEMVGPAIFLASRAASFCTGVNLLVDGGFVCW